MSKMSRIALAVSLLAVSCSDREGRSSSITTADPTAGTKREAASEEVPVPPPPPPPPPRVKLGPGPVADEAGARDFAAAVPNGKVDSTVAPVRWEVKGLGTTKGLIIGRHLTAEGPRMAMVALKEGAAVSPEGRLDLPVTDAVDIIAAVDLDASSTDGSPPPLETPPGAIVFAEDARAPALLLRAKSTHPTKGGRSDLVGVDLRGGTMKVFLTFPLASHEPGTTSFSTIAGPSLFRGDAPLLDITLTQHAHPSSSSGRPGPPTRFTCRYSDDRYECGR